MGNKPVRVRKLQTQRAGARARATRQRQSARSKPWSAAQAGGWLARPRCGCMQRDAGPRAVRCRPSNCVLPCCLSIGVVRWSSGRGQMSICAGVMQFRRPAAPGEGDGLVRAWTWLHPYRSMEGCGTLCALPWCLCARACSPVGVPVHSTRTARMCARAACTYVRARHSHVHAGACLHAGAHANASRERQGGCGVCPRRRGRDRDIAPHRPRSVQGPTRVHGASA